jgi:hypothetical protein
MYFVPVVNPAVRTPGGLRLGMTREEGTLIEKILTKILNRRDGNKNFSYHFAFYAPKASPLVPHRGVPLSGVVFLDACVTETKGSVLCSANRTAPA